MATTLPRAMVDLDEFTESINLMVYADTGTGKTELVGHLPGKVLIISSENGTMVIKRMMSRLGWPAKEVKRFKVWPVRKWQDLEDAYIWVRDNPDVFDWVAIDSATSVQARAMRAAMEKAVEHNPAKRDIDLPDRGEHQKMQNAMKRMVQDFNELPVNTFWLAQAMHREDQDGNELVLPFIMGKDYEVSAFVCAQMQAFAYYKKRAVKVKVTVRGKEMTKTVTERVLIWDSFADSNDVIYWAKDRYQVMPRSIVLARGEEQLVPFSKVIEKITSLSAEDIAAASKARDEDVSDARAYKGTIEPEDDTEDAPDTPDDDADDEESEEEGSTPARTARPAATKSAENKVAAKKAVAAGKKGGRKFRPASEDEE